MTTRNATRNYSESIIYKLCCKDLTVVEIYIGSTTNFKVRKNQHSYNSQYGKIKVYEYIRENGGFSNWDMIQVEQYNAKDKRDLESRERYWLETLNATLNNNIPCSSGKESDKRYNDKNKEKAKEYYEENKEKIKEYSKEHAKKYREKNKEKIKESRKIYRQTIACECGGVYRKDTKERHDLTQKHINFKSLPA